MSSAGPSHRAVATAPRPTRIPSGCPKFDGHDSRAVCARMPAGGCVRQRGKRQSHQPVTSAIPGVPHMLRKRVLNPYYVMTGRLAEVLKREGNQ